MKLQITGKHMELGDALQTYCEEALAKLMEKFSAHPINCQVVFSKKEHQQMEADLSLHLGRGVFMRTHGQGSDAKICFDTALKRAHEKMARHKERLDDHHKHHDNHAFQKLSAIDSILSGTWAEGKAEEEPQIVEENTHDIPVLSVGGAAMHLELADVSVLVFRHKTTGRVNVVYKRADGKISWVNPES